MPSFLKDITPFYETEKYNEKGQSLEQFLEAYDPKKYEQPSVTTDILVLQHKNNFQTISKDLKLLLIQRKNHPSIGSWALPGGFIEMHENIIDAAKRELKEETGLDHIPIEQLQTWGDYNRDPRSRIVTVSYLALVEEGRNVKAGDDAADACFFDVTFQPIAHSIKENRFHDIYEMTFVNKERALHLSATILVTQNKSGLLREKEYKVLERKGIAFDHPAIIGQGLLYIQGLLNNEQH